LSPILGIIASSFAASTTSYESIATTTVGAGGSATVTFSSIPSTYKHLQIRGFGRNTTATANMGLRFNSDSGTTNYRSHYLYGDGAAGAGDYGSGASWLYLGSAPSTANTFAGVVIDVLDYTSTAKNKTIRALHGYDLNGSGVVQLISGLWMNSASAVSSIDLVMGANNYAQYSSFALYGIKG
jgi:hypothetical protein